MSLSLTRWSALGTILLIVLLDSIDSSSGRSCSGTTETLKRCLALVNPEVIPRPIILQGNRDCILPNIENSRIVYASNPNVTLTGDEPVPNLFLIIYECISPYVRMGPKFNICYNGRWYVEAEPTCKIYTHFCPKSDIYDIKTQTVCVRDDLMVSCDEPILPGTVARIRCRDQYEPLKGPDTVLCLEDGRWNDHVIQCSAVCGQIEKRSTPFVADGAFVDLTFVPWHVAIYKNISGKYVYHCGGTIIADNQILSVSYCFLKPNTNNIEDYSLFLVGAGKHLGNYRSNDPGAQFRTISAIQMNSKRDGITQIWLKEPLLFTPIIAPVCLPASQFDVRQRGNLVNYGREKNGQISRDTRVLGVSNENSYIDCGTIKVDEICTTITCVRTLCRNFIGSGFTGAMMVNGIRKQHLVGIANVTGNLIKILQN